MLEVDFYVYKTRFARVGERGREIKYLCQECHCFFHNVSEPVIIKPSKFCDPAKQLDERGRHKSLQISPSWCKKANHVISYHTQREKIMRREQKNKQTNKQTCTIDIWFWIRNPGKSITNYSHSFTRTKWENLTEKKNMQYIMWYWEQIPEKKAEKP